LKFTKEIDIEINFFNEKVNWKRISKANINYKIEINENGNINIVSDNHGFYAVTISTLHSNITLFDYIFTVLPKNMQILRQTSLENMKIIKDRKKKSN
jgi:hypothetical protein